MAVAFDAVTTQATGSEAAFNHTPSGTPTGVLVSIHVRGNADDTSDISAVTYGGESMTKIAWIDTNGNLSGPMVGGANTVILFKLETNVPSGTQSVAITRSGSATQSIVIACRTFTGSGTFGTPITDSDGTNTTSTTGNQVVSSSTGDLVADALSTQEAEDHTPDGGSQTERFDTYDGAAQGSGSDKAGAASVTMSWSWTTVTRWAYAAFNINAAASGPDAAVISKNDMTDDVGGIVDVDSYDATAASHDLYRSTATMSSDPETNGTLVVGNFDPDLPVVDDSVDPDTLYYWAVVSRDGIGGSTASNEVSFRTAPARPTTVWEGLNIIAAPTMDTDSGGDGVVDAWSSAPSGAHTVAFSLNPTFLCQVIQVTAATGSGGSSVVQNRSVVADKEYTFTINCRVVSPVGNFRGKVVIQWFDGLGGYISGQDAETEFTNTTFADVSATGTAPSNAATCRLRCTAITDLAGDTGTVQCRRAKAYRTDHNTGTQAIISWEDQSGGTRGWKVFQDGIPIWTAPAGVGVQYATITGLTPDESYDFVVLSEGPGGELSGWNYIFTLNATAPPPPEPPPTATLTGTLAYFDFSVAIDPIRTTGSIQRVPGVQSAVNLVNRDGFLTAVHGRDASMEWLSVVEDVLPMPVQGFSLFPARTNLFTESADFTGWTAYDSASVTSNVGMAPNRIVEADQIADANASASARIDDTITITDDGSYYTISMFVVKNASATTFARILAELENGTTEITGTGIDIDPSDGSWQVVGSPTAAGVRDTGWAFRAWVIVKNNSSGNTTLRSTIYPAYGSTLGTQDVSSQGSVIVWGHDIGIGPMLTPTVRTQGTTASHSARKFPLLYLGKPGAMSGYIQLVPWTLGGTGTYWRLLTIGGDALTAGEMALSIHMDTSTAGRIRMKLQNATGSVNALVDNAWALGDLLEVFFTISSTGVVNLSTSVNWGTWVDSGASGTLTLASQYEQQGAALNECIKDGSDRGCATYLMAKFNADDTLTKDQMRDIYYDGAEGIGV